MSTLLVVRREYSDAILSACNTTGRPPKICNTALYPLFLQNSTSKMTSWLNTVGVLSNLEAIVAIVIFFYASCKERKSSLLHLTLTFSMECNTTSLGSLQIPGEVDHHLQNEFSKFVPPSFPLCLNNSEYTPKHGQVYSLQTF